MKVNKQACNLLYEILNFSLFRDYGTLLLILVLIIIVANLIEFDFNKLKNMFVEKSHSNNIKEGFTISYTFPGRYFLKDSNNNFIYIKSNGTFVKSKIMTDEIKRNSYTVLETTPNEGASILLLPALEREWKDIFNITDDLENKIVNSTKTSIKLNLIQSIQSDIIDNSSKKFKLRYVNSSDETATTPSYFIIQNNTANSIISTEVDASTGASEFTIIHYNEGVNQLFEPIIDNSVKINVFPDKNSLDIEFNVDPSATNIDNYMIVLAKYDYERNLIGHLKVHASQETQSGKGICLMENGYRKCKYTLTDIDHVDNDGNILYYRVSVIPVDNNGVPANYIEPVYPGGYSHFVMAKSNEEMDRVINKIKEIDKARTERKDLNDEIISEATGEYNFLKRQLGGYPDALIYDINKNTLNELVNESMALGEINLNVSNM